MNDENDNHPQPGQPGEVVFGRRTEAPEPSPPAAAGPPQGSVPPEGTYRTDYVARSPEEILQPRDVPPPARRSRHARNRLVVFLNFCMSLVVLAFLGMGATFYFGKLRFEEAGPLQRARTIVIEDGSSLDRIAATLQGQGIITSDFIFSQGVKATRNTQALKAGEYAFKPGMSMREVMDTIVSGKGIIHKVSIPEGWTSYQIMQRIAENDVLEGDMPQEVPLEGSLLPDTYPFQRGTTRKEIIDQMQRQQTRYLKQIWDRRIDGLPISSPEELVVLASIVEKETGKADERPRVASVFINRLNKGMRLQSDPTILYGLFGGQGKPKDRPIFKSDIDRPTPYNTYQIDGLPPTPIANPGIAAMEAVANPSRTEDLYFVADGTGGHVFATTLKEHNDNVTRWRAIEKRLQEEAKKAAAETGTAAGLEEMAGSGPSGEPADTTSQ